MHLLEIFAGQHKGAPGVAKLGNTQDYLELLAHLPAAACMSATEPHPCYSPCQVCVILLGHPPSPHLTLVQGAQAGQQQRLSPTRSTSRYSVPSARASLEDIAGPGPMPSVMRWESLGALENLLENEPMSAAAGGLKPLKSNSFSALTAAFRAAGVNVVAEDEGDAQEPSKVRCVCPMGVGCLWYRSAS